MSEIRLVACGQTADGRVLPIDDDSWDRGLTDDDASRLTVYEEGEPEAEHAYLKLRSAFSESS